MCAVFGFLDYKGKISNAVLKKLIHYLSVAAEVRGTDATGIAYVRDGGMVTYKKPKPAHKVKLFFPRGTRSVIGHTRFTTQGSEKRNCNNHPFEGHCGKESLALAHNGVLYNDRELRREQHLPPTPIENEPSIVYGGKKYTEYEISQMQRAAQLPCRAPWTTQKTTTQKRHYPEIMQQQRQSSNSWRLICGTFAGRPGGGTTHSGSRCTALGAVRRRGLCALRQKRND